MSNSTSKPKSSKGQLAQQLFFFLGYFMLVLTFLACGTTSQQSAEENDTSANEINWIDFKWRSDTLAGRYYEKLAIELPLVINDSNLFLADFDLGANTNILFEDELRSYFDIEKDFNFDTVETGDNYYFIHNPDIKMGSMKTNLNKWVVLKGYSSNNLIGTIGVEEFHDKCLVIDYPNQRLSVFDSAASLPFEDTEWIDIDLMHGKVLMYISVNGKLYPAIFDSGASFAPLLISDRNTYDAITDPELGVDTLRGLQSWGEIFELIPGAKVAQNVSIAHINLDSMMAFYIESKYHKAMYEEDSIHTLLGSAAFSHKMVIIDFQNKKFGLRNSN